MSIYICWFMYLPGGLMKYLSLIVWVTQFGFSLLFPLCMFLYIGYWLQNRLGLGIWVMVLCGIIGLMTSVSTVRSCLRSMMKEIERISSKEEPPMAFNDHH